MWCAACHQDVPGVAASANNTKACCARCGQAFARAVAPEAPSVPFEDLPEFVELEDWEFAETIQEAERLVRNVTADLGPAPRWDRLRESRRDRPVRRAAHRQEMVEDRVSKSNSTLPWIVLALGLGVFVCGAALIALSLVQQRPQLWQLGLPLVLVGQVAVLAVVIGQLDAVSNSNRATFVALHAMDDQVRQLRDAWDQQPAETPERPFYRHLAEGANPDVLLADLKDQIDVLADHLAQTKRAA